MQGVKVLSTIVDEIRRSMKLLRDGRKDGKLDAYVAP